MKNQKIIPVSEREPEIRNSKVLNIRPDMLICLLLVLATFFVYWQVRDHAFINFDDDHYVYKNSHVSTGLTWENVVWAFTTTNGANWHPVTWLSHMTDTTLYGLNPGQHHLTNVIFHILNSLLLFFLFRRMTGALWRSGFVAALFALHPLHVESVAWVAERKDVLSTFFCFLTLHCYVRYAEHPNRKIYLMTIIFFILGLMSKPMLVTLPFVFLLLDYWPLGRFPRETQNAQGFPVKKRTQFLFLSRIFVIEKLPFFALSAGSSIVTFLVQQGAGATACIEYCPLHFRLANALVSYAAYIVKMVYPHPLAVLYPHPGMQPWWKITGAAFLLMFLCVFVIRYAKSSPCLITGWLWYLGTLVPVIGLVQVGIQSMADRYTYIPLIGLFIILGWGIPDIFFRKRQGENLFSKIFRIGIPAAAISVIFVFTVLSWLQLRHWSDGITLYKHTLNVTSGSYIVYYNMGNTLLSRGRFDESLPYYYKALQRDPESFDAHNNIGLVLAQKGKTDKAIAHYREALRIKPDFSNPYNNLGNLFASQGRINKAIDHYREALLREPENAEALNNLGLSLIRIGKLEEAIAHFQKALKVKPDHGGAYRNLNRALALREKLDQAVANMDEAMNMTPADPDFTNKLENLSQKKKELDEAIEFYQKALSPQPGYRRDTLNIDNYTKVRKIKKEYDKMRNEE
ncbi:tetratricopeptide repeat protein [Desulfonema magnum]|uniref:Glycosyltransferase domain-containing protein, tetratricopeptide repeat-containing n=1 Tax=Desulfonema magnum TaxID=45655 RepID=A0A975GSX3_9BACT|nr:tetratricopeptide repeat protein [Desulfonema magnum]QTA92397.1 Glycosyltransferase domain-containing protein, tetratricopeptide repeat-containing [Desulfonema magnum]